jgi:hypothetical protein
MTRARCSLVALALVVGCAEKAAVKPTSDSALPIVASSSPGTEKDCPDTGLWARCSVLKRLERSGLTVHADSLKEIREPALTIVGERLPIAGGEIELFVYADSGSRARDAAKLDPKAFISPDRQPTILGERTLIANENLLVLMKIFSEANRERIANALLAGPPLPPLSR